VRGISKRGLEDLPDDLRAAMKPFLLDAKAGDPPAKPRLVKVEPKCRFTLDDDWYRELVNNATVDEGYSIETAQLIDVPGEPECGVLVGGFTPDATSGSYDVDSFHGPDTVLMPRCPDPAGGYEVMRRQGKIERFKTGMGNLGDSALSSVLDTATGNRYYLRDEDSGWCGGRRNLPGLYAWNETPRGTRLESVRSLELENALFEQCHPQEDDYEIICDGIGVPGKPDGNMKYDAMDYPVFLKTLGAARHDAYMAAILALDKPKLRAMQQLGLPESWTAEAIERVGAFDLSIEEKRRRTAWIFYDNEQLARALRREWNAWRPTSDYYLTHPSPRKILTSLLDWLPREDWRPILRVIEKHDLDVRYLRAMAKERGLDRLACELDHAQGLICGGDWSAQAE
jgi:hypothetical protein